MHGGEGTQCLRRPEVLRMTWPTDQLGAAYERRVNSWDGLALFRILRVGELREG